MKRAVPAFLVLALAAAACGGGDATDGSSIATDGATSTTVPTTTTASRQTTTTSEASGEVSLLWPLRGEPLGSEDPGEILIAKYSNAPRGRPQVGLEQADVLMEVVVEGGVVRIIAVFQSEIPETVGPLRSAREVDPKLVAPFDGFFASSGGQGFVIADIAEVAVNASDGRVAGYFREPTRSAPYDLFLNTEAVFDMDERGTQPAWPLGFGDLPEAGDFDQALSVEVDISRFHTTNYRYSAADDGYLRFNGEEPHVSVDDEQHVAQTVVALFVPQLSTGRVDGSGAPVPDYEVVGTGRSVVFRDGVAIEGTWERGQEGDFFRLFDAGGSPVLLKPGQTWFEIVPDTRSVDWQ